MNNKLNTLVASLLLTLSAALPGCSDDEAAAPSGGGSAGTTTSSGGSSGAGGSGTSSAGTAVTTGGSSAAGTGGATNGGAAGTNVGGASGAAGDGGAAGEPGVPFVYFVKQTNGTTTATLENGSFSVSSTYGASGNAFKYVAPNYYGTVSNGFIALPTPMSGDFSISAEVTVTAQNKANNACGIGLGMTTGFNGTDAYGYALMRNSSNVVNGYYVNGAGTISAGAPAVPFTDGTPLALSFVRAGDMLTYGAGPVGSALTTQSTSASLFTNGTTAYGAGPVYPAISFNNVAATITKLIIKDAAGATVYDSATGALVTYVPASLTLSASNVNVPKGATTTVTATAVATGGAVSAVTAVSANPAVATASVTNGAASSTVTLTGVSGGVTTVTVTNTSDTSSVTSTKTLTVAVDDFATTDPYGSLTARTYPSAGATGAHVDGELSLTFDAPPVLNAGGSIKIYKQSDGTQVDSIRFEGETQTFGTTAINVGAQLVRVSGNTLFFTPHLGKLAYGTAYYVAIPTTSITGTLNGVAFNGLSNASATASWKLTTKAAPTLDPADITVDGSTLSTADFRTVQGALNAAAASLGAAKSVTIAVAAGTYRELLRYSGPGAAAGQTIHLVGPPGNDRGDDCVIQFTNGNGMNGSTATRAAAYFTGASLVLENVTLKNTATRSSVSQAEALYFAGGSAFTLAAFNSSFSSNQDTLQTSGRAWLYDCYVEGNVDFVWGTSDATLIESSDLRFINDLGGAAASYSLFVARTGSTIAAAQSGTIGKGYVLLDSRVSVDANVTAYFGRDAGTGAFYDQAALIDVTFTGAGMVGAGLWNVATAPLSLGDSSYVGWKSAGVSGLNLATLTTDAKTSATIASQSTEYATRGQILNRVVTVTAGAPSGFQAAATTWDLSGLEAAWGVP